MKKKPKEKVVILRTEVDALAAAGLGDVEIGKRLGGPKGRIGQTTIRNFRLKSKPSYAGDSYRAVRFQSLKAKQPTAAPQRQELPGDLVVAAEFMVRAMKEAGIDSVMVYSSGKYQVVRSKVESFEV